MVIEQSLIIEATKLLVSLLVYSSSSVIIGAIEALYTYFLGDDTAAQEGFLSLNPPVYMSFSGLLMLLFFGIGWVKPVPVMRENIKEPFASLKYYSVYALRILLFFILFYAGLFYLYADGFLIFDEQTKITHINPQSYSSLQEALPFFVASTFMSFGFGMMVLSIITPFITKAFEFIAQKYADEETNLPLFLLSGILIFIAISPACKLVESLLVRYILW